MNIIAYRLPNEEEVFYYTAGNIEKVNFCPSENGLSCRIITPKAYIVSPFITSRGFFQYPLCQRIGKIPQDIIGCNNINRKFREINKMEYASYIDSIIRFIGHDESKKIVASRRFTIPFSQDINLLFDNLCTNYPDAFVFFISTKDFGSWIGASPELLLERKGNILSTMSLAGTRSVGIDGAWDTKNIKEQEIVTEYLINIFRSYGLKPSIISKGTRRAGNIEHLMTQIESLISQDLNIYSLLKTLSPTPALSGFPKEAAIKIINKIEGDRSLYGGFMGPIYSNGDFRMNVVLRCAFLSPNSATLFAGGGITYLSEPESEWIETEKKLDTIRRILQLF